MNPKLIALYYKYQPIFLYIYIYMYMQYIYIYITRKA